MCCYLNCSVLGSLPNPSHFFSCVFEPVSQYYSQSVNNEYIERLIYFITRMSGEVYLEGCYGWRTMNGAILDYRVRPHLKTPIRAQFCLRSALGETPGWSASSQAKQSLSFLGTHAGDKRAGVASSLLALGSSGQVQELAFNLKGLLVYFLVL